MIGHVGYGVHGNETSWSEAALLMAYWRVAGQTAEVLGNEVWNKYPWVGDTRPITTDGKELLLNKTWRPQLEITGIWDPQPDAALTLARNVTPEIVSIVERILTDDLDAFVGRGPQSAIDIVDDGAVEGTADLQDVDLRFWGLRGGGRVQQGEQHRQHDHAPQPATRACATSRVRCCRRTSTAS